MPRIRTVKPEFWRSPDIMELDDFQQLLYIGLWNFTDDEGRGTYNPMALAADIFLRKYADDPKGVTADIENAFKAYAKRDMVTVYRVEGRDYYQINHWADHQKINRPQKSKIPPLDQAEQVIHGAFTEQSVNDHGGIMEDSLWERKGREGKERGEEGTESVNTHGTFTEPSLNASNETPSPNYDNLDALANAHAQEINTPVAPGVYGTPDEPRCQRHVSNPNPPPCGGCAKARQWFEKQQTEAKAEAERQRAEERARADACPYCEGGWRKGTNPAQKCDHQPKEHAA